MVEVGVALVVVEGFDVVNAAAGFIGASAVFPALAIDAGFGFEIVVGGNLVAVSVGLLVVVVVVVVDFVVGSGAARPTEACFGGFGVLFSFLWLSAAMAKPTRTAIRI